MLFDYGDLDVYLTELLLDPCEGNNVKDVKEKKKRKKADKSVCIAHPTDPLRFTIRKETKHKTKRVNGRWVV